MRTAQIPAALGGTGHCTSLDTSPSLEVVARVQHSQDSAKNTSLVFGGSETTSPLILSLLLSSNKLCSGLSGSAASLGCGIFMRITVSVSGPHFPAFMTR